MPFLFQSFKAKGGRTVQAEGKKYDPVRSISLRRWYNEIKENKCSCLRDIGRDGYMDYKKEIIEMIQKIHSESMIKFIYGCVKRAYKEERAEK